MTKNANPGSVALLDQGNSSWASSVPASVPAPNYNLLAAVGFSGANGAVINQADFAKLVGSNDPTYTTARPGPQGQASSGEFSIDQNGTLFGGNYVEAVDTPLSSGETIIISGGWFFPSAYCAGHAGQPDGYGSIKTLRLGYLTNGNRITWQMENYANQSCSAVPMRLGHCSFELPSEVVVDFPNKIDIIRDVWNIGCLKIFLHPTDGWVESWISTPDGQGGWNIGFQGRGLTRIGNNPTYRTIPDGTGWTIAQLSDAGYFNGFALQANVWGRDQVLVTKETPNTTDDEGRPIIHPSHGVEAFL